MNQQDQNINNPIIQRPSSFEEFIGQKTIKSILKTAIESAQKNKHTLGHILFSGPSGFGKTSLAHIISSKMKSNFYNITGYAITKPAEIISILQKLNDHDILFIDEIHRIKANMEEILYIAMEDQRIDIVMPDGTNLNLPIAKFTLVGATTKPESLSTPLKNRFIYNFHLDEYSHIEKKKIVSRYLQKLGIKTDNETIDEINNKTDHTPRNIKNMCIKIRDFLISQDTRELSKEVRKLCEERIDIDDFGMTILHKKYLNAFSSINNQQTLSLKTLATKLGVNEKTVEDDIEPLLMKLGYVDKTPRGRMRTK